MTYYLTGNDGSVWRWIDDPPNSRLEIVSCLPTGEEISGRINDRGEWGLEIRIDKYKRPSLK